MNLCDAAEAGDLDRVIELLRTNVYDKYDIPKALQSASKNGHLAVVELLIQNGADVHTNDDLALRLASKYGYLAVVKYLLQNGAGVHACNGRPLQCASENGRLAVVKYLLRKGADIHACFDYALKLACQNGHLNVVECLLEHGATFNPEWTHISDDIREFCINFQPLYIKSATKLS